MREGEGDKGGRVVLSGGANSEMNGGVVRVERRRMSKGGWSVVRTRTGRGGGKQRWNGRIREQKKDENSGRKRMNKTMEERGKGKVME